MYVTEPLYPAPHAKVKFDPYGCDADWEAVPDTPSASAFVGVGNVAFRPSHVTAVQTSLVLLKCPD